MVEMKPEYAARLKREQIQNAFLDDLQVVLDRWEAEMRADQDGHIEFTVYSPLYGDYDPDKPMVTFEESALWAGERDIKRMIERVVELETGMQVVIDREREKCAQAFRHMDWGRWSIDEIRSCISMHVNG